MHTHILVGTLFCAEVLGPSCTCSSSTSHCLASSNDGVSWWATFFWVCSLSFEYAARWVSLSTDTRFLLLVTPWWTESIQSLIRCPFFGLLWGGADWGNPHIWAQRSDEAAQSKILDVHQWSPKGPRHLGAGEDSTCQVLAECLQGIPWPTNSSSVTTQSYRRRNFQSYITCKWQCIHLGCHGLIDEGSGPNGCGHGASDLHWRRGWETLQLGLVGLCGSKAWCIIFGTWSPCTHSSFCDGTQASCDSKHSAPSQQWYFNYKQARHMQDWLGGAVGYPPPS